LTVGYPGGRTRQLSLRAEQVPQVRAWLDNYQQLKATMEAVCELNQRLLRPEAPATATEVSTRSRRSTKQI